MRSSPDRIIRGAEVSGIIFCSPSGQIEHEDAAVQEKESLKTLEDFWHQKGHQEGHKGGFDEGWKEGEASGYRRGLQEGEKKGVEEGAHSGREIGQKEGREQAQAELTSMIEVLKEVVDKFSSDKGKLFEQLKGDIVKLTLAVCEKILKQQVDNSKTFSSLVESLLNQAKFVFNEENVRVVLSPEDLERFESQLKAINYDQNTIKKLTFLSDSAIAKGNCRIEASMGLVNFDIRRQLSDLQETLLD
jgi:flagellar assembly protein FliH